jgi:hypothetical protein
MLVQYLVGICCAGRNPNAVKIVLGDAVNDEEAEEERDVDVTVAVDNGSDGAMAFQAYEVKREARSLSVDTVEQLCAKLLAMPSVTYRAIVSTSGFSKGALRKARKRGVDLYELQSTELPPWAKSPDGKPQIGGGTIESASSVSIDWGTKPYIHCSFPAGTPSVRISPDDAMLDDNGRVHKVYPRFALFASEVAARALKQIIRRPTDLVSHTTGNEVPATDRIPQHTEPVDVQHDGVYLRVEAKVAQVSQATATGDLLIRVEADRAQYVAFKKVGAEELLMNALVSPGPTDYTMAILTFEEGSTTIGVHPITLPKAHRNRINQLYLRPAEPDDHQEPEMSIVFRYPI